MSVQGFRGDLHHLLLIAVLADAIGLLPEHLLPEPDRGIGALIIDLGEDCVNEVDLLTLHIVLPKYAALQHRVQQKAAKQGAGVLSQVLPLQRISLVDVVQKKTDCLNLALFAHSRLDPRTIALIQPRRKLTHIRTNTAASQKHIRQQRIHGVLLLTERAKQTHG